MFYVALSALCFIMPYFFPFISPLLFLSFIPLLYRSYQRQLTFKQGCVWGGIVYSIHLLWLLGLIISRGTGVLRISLYFSTVTWMCIWTGLWFCLITYFYKLKLFNLRLKNYNLIVSWLIPTIFYFYFILHISMFPTGAIEGYTFINPFIPLAYYPQLIWCISLIGTWGALVCLILFQIFLLFGYLDNVRYFIISILCILPFLCGFIFYQPIAMNTSHFCFIKPWWNFHKQHKDPMFVGYRMVHDVTQAVCNNCNAQVVVMPESTFAWNLYEYQQFVPILCECAQDIPIVFGAQKKINNQLYNSCFVIQNGNVVWEYDKIHLMPLVERIPSLLRFEIFTKKDDVFVYGNSDQSDIVELCGNRYQIYICSELFCEAKKNKGIPLLFLYNDEWLYSYYMKRLAYLFIKYTSIKYQVAIVAFSTNNFKNQDSVF